MLFWCNFILFHQICFHFCNQITLQSHVYMFDDFQVVSNYGKFSAQFHVGRSRHNRSIFDVVMHSNKQTSP